MHHGGLAGMDARPAVVLEHQVGLEQGSYLRHLVAARERGARTPLQNTTANSKTAMQATRPLDWFCPCGQSNWSWRRICYFCYMPKAVDAANTTISTGAVIRSASSEIHDDRISDTKPSMPASSSSGNAADGKTATPGKRRPRSDPPEIFRGR